MIRGYVLYGMGIEHWVRKSYRMIYKECEGLMAVILAKKGVCTCSTKESEVRGEV